VARSEGVTSKEQPRGFFNDLGLVTKSIGHEEERRENQKMLNRQKGNKALG